MRFLASLCSRRDFTRLALALIFLALPTLAHAQSTVSGTVVDQRNQQPISGANVSIVGAHVSGATDESGRFSLTTDKDFSALVVTRIGYARRQVAVTDKSQPLTIELTPSDVAMSGTEVSADAMRQKQLETAKSDAVLTPRDLHRANGLNLESSLNTIPGVLMQSRAPWGGAHIQIRGYYPNFSQNSNGFGYQLFLNDIPVTDASGSTVMDDVDPTSLGSVEVIKGPVASEFGSSIAGAVSMRTALPADGVHDLREEAVGGSDQLFRTNTVFDAGGDHSAISFGYGHQTYDSFRPNSRSRKDFARFVGDFQVGEKQDVSTYFSYNNSYEQLAGEIDSTDFYNEQAIDNPVYALNFSKIAIESSRLGVTHQYRFSDALATRTTVFNTTQTMSQPFAHGFTDVNRFSLGGRSALDVSTHAGSVPLHGTVGGFFQRTNYTSNGFFLPASSPSDQENYAMNYYGFTEWTAKLPSALVLSAGTGVNKTEFGIHNLLKNKIINDTTVVYRRAFQAEVTPHASLLRKFGDAASLYASVGLGYTSPNLSSIINSDNTINTGLDPERAVQYEVGSKGSLGRKLDYDLAVFDLEIRDKLVSQRIGAVNSTTNAGKQRNQGLELALSFLAVNDPEKTISMVRPWASYTYSDFKYKDFKSDANNNASTVDFSGKEVARVPRNVLNAGLDAATRTGFYLNSSYQYVSRVFVTFDNSNQLKSYSLLSAKVGFQKPLNARFTLDLAAGGDNLLSDTYYTFTFVGPNYTGLAQPKDGGTGDGYIIPGPYKATYYGSARISVGL